jgi:hypothetical protein
VQTLNKPSQRKTTHWPNNGQSVHVFRCLGRYVQKGRPMKNLIIFMLLVFTTKSFSNTEEKKCFILSSPPNYENMNLITVESLWQDIPVVQGKEFKYVSFRDAYKTFYNNAIKSIKDTCRENNVDGAVNFKINHSVRDKWYYFSATYDVWRFK